MTTPLFSTYRQGENRVTATFLGVLQRLSLPNIDRILRTLLEEDSFSLVSFENQVRTGTSVPDAKIGAGGTIKAIWVETKTSPNAVHIQQIRQHLESVSEGEKLLVLTPDGDRPIALDQIDEEKVAWSNFSNLAQVVAEILKDEDEPPADREAFLLRELVFMLREDGLLGRPDVVVVASSSGASSAWRMYNELHVYRSALSLPFRDPSQFDRMAFYGDGEIKPIIPRVRRVIESINLTRKEEVDALDSSSKEFAVNLLDKIGDNHEYRSWFDGDLKIMFLSEPSDAVDLRKSIPNDKVSKSGKRVPFTYGKPRYVSLDSLREARTTTELEQLESR